ncbi:hypothetical protein Poli38472_003634 [Pythium oligandrum]|uniref:DASH complex subunit DAM1 n=1 Tax=Pythium oligandrum TaxID=41045 RepID=A0A8K1CML4_PYTOL|nr:hypothetical protein Poli38472_003634 [Pythium oligandrum]|eukprot:TMW65869.1 hypothetical protein Poli38472_003634 [Pythium oligandrum]
MESVTETFATLCYALQGLHAQVETLAVVHDAIGEFNQVFGTFQNAMALHASCLEFPLKKKTTPSPALVTRPTGIPKPQIVTNRSESGKLSTGSAGEAGALTPKDRESAGSTTSAPGNRASLGKRSSGSGSKIKKPSPVAAVKPPMAKKKAPLGKKRPTGRAAAAAAALKRDPRPDTAPWKWDKNLRDSIPRKYQSETELAKLQNILIYLKNRQSGITIADLVKHSGLAVIRCKEILQTLTKLDLISRRQEDVGFIYTFGRSDA